MKDIYYYADVELKAFDTPQPNREALTTSMLTRSMLDFIWWKHSTKVEKYPARIPKSIIHDIDNLPLSKFDISFVNDFEGQDPIAEAVIEFKNHTVHVFCRRVLMMPTGFENCCESHIGQS